MEITRYKDLPDGMSADELRPFFDEVLAEAEQLSVSSTEVARALYELADRQWHTYQRLDLALRARVESCLRSRWVVMPEFVRPAGFVISSLGLLGALPLLSASLDQTTDPDLLSDIRAVLNDPDIGDPYAGLSQHQPNVA